MAALMLVSAFLYGRSRLDEMGAAIEAAASLRVALVRSGLSNEARLAPHRAAEIVERFLSAGPAGGAAVDLVVWPENTVPVLLADNPDLVSRIAERAVRTKYLIGAPRLVEARSRSLRTSAFLIGESGIEGVYDKLRLLPGAEVARSGRSDELGFSAGQLVPSLVAGGVRLGATICYEAVFPDLARAAVSSGAGLLVNLSNDSWFAAGAGPELHFQQGLLRAVETRRSMVRVSNGGVTALVLPDGRVVARDGGAGSLLVAAPILEGKSTYVRFGDWFAWTCIIAALATVLV